MKFPAVRIIDFEDGMKLLKILQLVSVITWREGQKPTQYEPCDGGWLLIRHSDTGCNSDAGLARASERLNKKANHNLDVTREEFIDFCKKWFPKKGFFK